MSVSGDYDVDTFGFFKREFVEDLRQTINGSTIVKAVNVVVQFQTRQPGVLWGETLENRTFSSEKTYPVRTTAPSEETLLADFKASLRQYNPCEVIKEVESLSEQTQQLIARLIKNQSEQNINLKKITMCYHDIVRNMKSVVGEKQLSSIDMKIVYVKLSNLSQDLVYEKRYSPALKQQQVILV